ncbi:hypothetical protein [Marivita cryptomonadis]|uniref:hypothetical protein n=1 Tax=Marivita cryptomonadis TaxID=505252 RepID=UPI00391BCAAB
MTGPGWRGLARGTGIRFTQPESGQRQHDADAQQARISPIATRLAAAAGPENALL